MASSDSKVLPTWTPTTKLESVHYYGEDGSKTGCWSGIGQINSISAWASEEIERRRNECNGKQETNVDPTATIPEPETDIGPGPYNGILRHDFTSNSLALTGLIMPDHIVGYGPSESKVLPPTTLSKEESEQEGGNTIVPG
jgi:hypothetical protein